MRAVAAGDSVYDARVKAEIVTIGDELCRGEIADTNAAYLAAALWREGITCTWITSCRDVVADIRDAVTRAAARASVVIVSGGLGPTTDDLTVDVMSALCGTEPEIEPDARRRLEARYAAHGRPVKPESERQVRIPGGAKPLANPIGAAPGFEVSIGGTPVFCLPGVPAELRAIFTTHVVPLLGGDPGVRCEERYRIFGIGESDVAAKLAGLGDDDPGITIHYRVKFPEILVKVVTRGDDAAAKLAAADRSIRERLRHRVVASGDQGGLPDAVVQLLGDRGWTLATAESCTGGLIGALVTDVAGASAIYRGGVIAYSNDVKVQALGVSEDTLEAHGAVSAACVAEMARGARERLVADWAVAVSGIAGPAGGSTEKPVGTVFIAAAGPGDAILERKLLWPGDREAVRRLAAYAALDLVRRGVTEKSTNG